MKDWPRVAFFSDSFHGVDGVATTCRKVVGATRKRALPFLAVHAGPRTRRIQDGSVDALELKRSPLSFQIDRHLGFDLLFPRHYQHVLSVVRDFRPDVVHITGPGDIGITGARVAYDLNVPLVAAWHTNLHEFAARRLAKMAQGLPESVRRRLAAETEESVLRACMRFYRLARVILAPNVEHMRLLAARTGRPVFPMRRGVDTNLFSPIKRSVRDGIFRLGYVGRLRAEKNVRFLANLEAALRADGISKYRFLIVGEGSERPWLERKLIQADFTGELHGEFLAEAYANMDLFVFPSETETFGNVVLESMASGTPVVVTGRGGPKYLVQDGTTGFVAADAEEFISSVKGAIRSPTMLRSLREAGRALAASRSWDDVLLDLYSAYDAGLRLPRVRTTENLASSTMYLRRPGAPLRQG
jgi:phosphatidylinositol alpha 1,6-mannosyltransferase